MRLLGKSLYALIGLCMAGFTAYATSPTTNEVLVQDQNQFAWNLLEKTIATEKLDGKNAFMSPYSISTAMAMVYMGSQGQTKLDLASGLSISLPASLIPGLYSQQMQDLTAEKSKDGYDLQLANHFWAQEGFGFLPEYTTMLENEFESGITEYDFIDDAQREAAIADINLWADENTNGKITKVVDDNTVTKQTRFVLTNAIYFLADWLKPFSRHANQPPQMDDFTLANGETKEVEFMSQTEWFNYFSNDQMAAVELAYGKPMLDENGKVMTGWTGEPKMEAAPVSMWVVLPKAGQSLKGLMATLTAGKLENAFMNAKGAEVFVKMPPFKVEAEYKLKSTMRDAMGMASAFSNNADFSDMNGRQDLTIGEVIHKTFIRVDNKGTEAAAVTAVIGLEKTSIDPTMPEQFVADTPFLYVIRDSDTGAILFIGTMNDPS